MTAPTRPRTIAALDTPLAVVRSAAILLEAAARTHSVSDRIGDSHAAWLVTHPDAPISTSAAGWDYRIAQLNKLNRLWAEAAAFNAVNPVGTSVTAYPGARPEDDANTTRLDTVTRSRATVLGGHTAVVWVDGESSCIALSHIDVRTGGAS